ncbi:unnamed protein product [Ixodes pacificus]
MPFYFVGSCLYFMLKCIDITFFKHRAMEFDLPDRAVSVLQHLFLITSVSLFFFSILYLSVFLFLCFFYSLLFNSLLLSLSISCISLVYRLNAYTSLLLFELFLNIPTAAPLAALAGLRT